MTLYFDGASKGNPGPAGIGAVIFANSEGKHEIKKFIGIATNNQAEYTALLTGLQAALDLGANKLQIFSDSELVINQLKGTYQIKDEKLKTLYLKAVELSGKFKEISYQHVPREKNKIADALANEAVKEARATLEPSYESASKLSSPKNVKDIFLELRINSEFFVPSVMKFIKNLIEEVNLPPEQEPTISLLTALQKAEKSCGEKKTGLYLRFFCDSENTQLELNLEEQKPLLYHQSKIPKTNKTA
jgi:ribonuclease HI